jgi:peptidyl-prolyl cis-trans isomerase B (cyclophilin B)
MRAALLALLLALLLAASACGGDGDDDGEPAASGEGECESVEAADPREPETREEPSEPLDAAKSYALVVDTSCGSFTIALDLARAPKTSASLVALAQDGYFDDTTFHRVVPDFVIQGGDPTASGSGGPGYKTVDAPPAGASYVKGVVAMAKADFEPPGTSGSQFFVVTGEDIMLPADYAIVGEVSQGIETVDRINALGVADGPPSQPVNIETVTVEES